MATKPQSINGFNDSYSQTRAFFLGMIGSLFAGLIVWGIQSKVKPTPLSFTRELGVPKSDIERAMTHYGITEDEYLAHSEWYPLPERGNGLL